MATLYFVKDGPGPENSGSGFKIDLHALKSHFPDIGVLHLGEEPPEFNAESPSQYPVKVVVEVTEAEKGEDEFNRQGFYLLKGVAPNDPRLQKFPKVLDT